MPFGSKEFYKFAKEWDFKITTSNPHYPKSNGLAERYVGIAKKMLQKSKEEGHVTQGWLEGGLSCAVAQGPAH
ncbi:hypothetical protein QTP88_001740 [Uroleucon formosanum]